MTRIAVIGGSPRVDGCGAAGALVFSAADPDEVRRRWDALPEDVEVVVLTPAAADAVADRIDDRLVAVLP